MSATILPFPAALTAPCRFTAEARGALIALAERRPRWEIEFGADDDGDDWAGYSDTLGVDGFRFMVDVLPGGSLMVREGFDIEHGTFATGAEAVEALREAGL